MLSERTIINGLLLLGGMILGPYLIVLTLEMNQMALLAFSSLVLLFCVFFFIKDRIAFFPFISVYFSGALNILGGFTPIEVTSLVAILYYVINYVILKRRPISAGPRYILIPMLVIGAIVLFHEHNLGLKILGSEEQGSRPALVILIAIVTYACAINIPTPSATFIRRVPFYCFGAISISSIPYLLTTFFPSLAPYLYYFTANVNLEAYKEAVSGTDGSDFARLGVLAGIGSTLQLVMICYKPINTWWHPKRWIYIILSVLCFGCVLLSGYRNNLLNYLLICLLATIAYSRWRILILLPLIALLPFAVVIVQNDHPLGLKVPNNMQRSMSFLPGNWDPEALDNTKSSNEFREDIRRVYLSEYFHKSPWIGNGFTYDPLEYEGLAAMSEASNVIDHQYYQSKAFILNKNFHIGWISLYDAVGIIGGLAFVTLNLALIWMTGRMVFQPRDNSTLFQIFPLKVFIFANLLSGMIGYFVTFGSFSQSFVGMCGTAIILVHLYRIENQNDPAPISPPQQKVITSMPGKVFSPLNSPMR